MDAKRVMPETVAAQALGWVDDATKAISPPIHTSTTFVRDEDNQYRNGRVYARDHNPSFDQAESSSTVDFQRPSASACLASRRWLVLASCPIFPAFPAVSRLGQSGSPLLHFLL